MNSKADRQCKPILMLSVPFSNLFQYFKTTLNFAVSKLIPVKEPVTITVFWDMKPCSVVEPTTSMFRALYCLTIEAACLSETFAPIY